MLRGARERPSPQEPREEKARQWRKGFLNGQWCHWFFKEGIYFVGQWSNQLKIESYSAPPETPIKICPRCDPDICVFNKPCIWSRFMWSQDHPWRIIKQTDGERWWGVGGGRSGRRNHLWDTSRAVRMGMEPPRNLRGKMEMWVGAWPWRPCSPYVRKSMNFALNVMENLSQYLKKKKKKWGNKIWGT